MTGIQEGGARGHHLGRVTQAARRAAAGLQVHVALAGEVERVARGAAQGAALLGQPAAADRTGQQLGGREAQTAWAAATIAR